MYKYSYRTFYSQTFYPNVINSQKKQQITWFSSVAPSDSLSILLFTSPCPKRLTFTGCIIRQSCPLATCYGLATGKHSAELKSRKRMRSEYLFSWPPPTGLWLEKGCIPGEQLFPTAVPPQVPVTALLFFSFRPKDDKVRSWMLYHLLLVLLSFLHLCKE